MSEITTVDLAIEAATDDGCALTAGVPPTGRRLSFAARFQAILIGVMFVGFVVIAQQQAKLLYQIGLPLLVVTAFLQIAFGNIPPASGFRKLMALLALTWLIVAAVFALGIFLAPHLIQLGR
jgi:hypothetical protein